MVPILTDADFLFKYNLRRGLEVVTKVKDVKLTCSVVFTDFNLELVKSGKSAHSVDPRILNIFQIPFPDWIPR
jgi:hypothetical protein